MKFRSALPYAVTVFVNDQAIRLDPDEPYETADPGVIEALEGMDDAKPEKRGRKRKEDE